MVNTDCGCSYNNGRRYPWGLALGAIASGTIMGLSNSSRYHHGHYGYYGPYNYNYHFGWNNFGLSDWDYDLWGTRSRYYDWSYGNYYSDYDPYYSNYGCFGSRRRNNCSNNHVDNCNSRRQTNRTNNSDCCNSHHYNNRINNCYGNYDNWFNDCFGSFDDYSDFGRGDYDLYNFDTDSLFGSKFGGGGNTFINCENLNVNIVNLGDESVMSMDY